MSACVCKHVQMRHCDGIGRCDGQSYDADLNTTYACVCPAYRDASQQDDE